MQVMFMQTDSKVHRSRDGWFGASMLLWALVALPAVLVASLFDLRMPRLRWVFYAYYPIHLFALCLIRIPMSKAGYLFF